MIGHQPLINQHHNRMSRLLHLGKFVLTTGVQCLIQIFQVIHSNQILFISY